MITTNVVNNTDFGCAFRNMLISRLDDPMTFAPLADSAAYREARQEYDRLYEAVFDSKNFADANIVQELLNALRALHDMEVNYLYRTGLQDGMLMLTPDFRTLGVA